MDFLKNPKLWIYSSVIYIWFLSIAKLFASLGPVFVIARIGRADNSLSFLDLKRAFLTYVTEAASRLSYNPEYVQYSLLSNVILYAPTLVVGFFVVKKRRWARKALLFMIALIFLQPLIGVITSDIGLGAFLGIDSIVLLLLIYFFTRRATKEALAKEKAT